MKFAQLTVWILVGLTFGLINIDEQLKLEFGFLALKVLIELFLLLFGAFQILKSTEIDIHKFDHVIVFHKQSARFYQLILMGLVLMVADCVLIDHYRELLSSDTIIAAILFLYYFAQILYQNKPRVLIGETTFVYDDYFPMTWKWSNVTKMQLEEEKMIISQGEEEFELSLAGTDEADPTQTGVELAAQVLDGSIHFIDDATNFRSLIIESAEKHGFPLDLNE